MGSENGGGWRNGRIDSRFATEDGHKVCFEQPKEYTADDSARYESLRFFLDPRDQPQPVGRSNARIEIWRGNAPVSRKPR